MTPSSLNTALKDKLRLNMDTSHLAGTIKSLDESLFDHVNSNNKIDDTDPDNKDDDQKLLPPSIPKYLRRQSREDEKLDKIDIDAENIETPPVTRRAVGIRSFKTPDDSRWTSSQQDDEDEISNRRNNRKFKSLTTEERRALDGVRPIHKDTDNLRRRPHSIVDSSENEGNASEIEEPGYARRSMRFKHLAVLAKEGDSDTREMLMKQSKLSQGGEDDCLGDGNFKRFS